MVLLRRITLQKLIDKTQENVNGDVNLKVFKGNVIIEEEDHRIVYMNPHLYLLMKKVIIIKKMLKVL